MKIKIVNKSKHGLPTYATAGSSCMDIKANIDGSIIVKPGSRILIPTGLFVELPLHYEMLLRPRSGLALKKGVTLVNSPGTIDSDFRGEIGVILINHGSEVFTINDGDRICQAIIKKYDQIEWEEVKTLNETERGAGGFGHTSI